MSEINSLKVISKYSTEGIQNIKLKHKKIHDILGPGYKNIKRNLDIPHLIM